MHIFQKNRSGHVSTDFGVGGCSDIRKRVGGQPPPLDQILYAIWHVYKNTNMICVPILNKLCTPPLEKILDTLPSGGVIVLAT